MSSAHNSSTPRPQRAEWLCLIGVALLILAVANLPVLLAYAAPAPYVFTGLLFNPVDGHSYLAKMREGWRGEWLFTLPYTAQPGPGVFIYTYYLFLGHVARWTGASLGLIYHLARVLGGLALLLSAYHFIARFFGDFRARLGVWLLFSLGSGLGWLALPFGGFTSDLWVAEFIPFLSIFSNAHFALTAALMLWVFEWTLPGLAAPRPSALHLTLTAFALTALAQTQPLALVTIGLVLGAMTAWGVVARRALTLAAVLPLAVVTVSSMPWLVYDFWAAAAQPVLRGWNAQNLTPSPPWWDALLSGGVPLLLALPGIVVTARRRRSPSGGRAPLDLAPLFWFGLGVLSLYAPFALQRRLSLGLWMPLVLLAAVGLRDGVWPRLATRWRPLALAAVIIGALLSNLLVYVATVGAVQMPVFKQGIFLTRGEADALTWLADNTPPGALVLAAPATGLFIPARTDARVIYGHPFETVDAQAHQQAVEDFFTGRTPPATFFAQYPVDYVFYGPREKALGSLPGLDGWSIVFQQGDATLYGH